MFVDLPDTNCICGADIYMEMEVASIILAAERTHGWDIDVYFCFALFCLLDRIIFIDIVCDQ